MNSPYSTKYRLVFNTKNNWKSPKYNLNVKNIFLCVAWYPKHLFTETFITWLVLGSAKLWLKLIRTESVLSSKSKITFSANKGQTEDIKEDQNKLNQNNSTQNPSIETKHWISNHAHLNKKFTGKQLLDF